MKLPDQITKLGFVGERKAIALLCLGFYATIFAVMGLIAMAQLPEWTACFFGLAACYVVGFFAVAADWFWGRWFAIGLAYSGVSMAAMAIIATRQLIPSMVVFGVMHAIAALCMMGEKMAAHYEARTEWRQRWQLDDAGVVRIKNSVTRAAGMLPSLIMWALAPRDGAALAVLALGVVGTVGLIRGRTWGVLALAGAGVGALWGAIASPVDYYYSMGSTLDRMLDVSAINPAASAAVAGALALAATAPFACPVARWLASRRLSE